MRNIAIVTARSGSKGLPDKNIKLLCGKPLLWYTVDAAIRSEMFDEVMVSTDSERYARIARECGANVPFLRSEGNSTSNASSWDVVKEVLEGYGRMEKTFDTVTLLQPTSPMRTPEHIREGYQLLEEKDANAVIGVSEEEHSPLWSNVLPEDGSMKGFIRPEIQDAPRQALEQYYRINGALYIVRAEVLEHVDSLYEDRCYAYVMEREVGIDIDTEFDFRIAELWMEYRETGLWNNNR